jgi:hypothetical protein
MVKLRKEKSLNAVHFSVCHHVPLNNLILPFQCFVFLFLPVMYILSGITSATTKKSSSSSSVVVDENSSNWCAGCGILNWFRIQERTEDIRERNIARKNNWNSKINEMHKCNMATI